MAASRQTDPTFGQLLRRPSGIMLERSNNKPLAGGLFPGADEDDEDADRGISPGSWGSASTSRRAKGSALGALAKLATEVIEPPSADFPERPEPDNDDEAPETQLRNAILENDVAQVRLILEAVDLSEEYYDEDGMHFLHIAIKLEADAIVALLIDDGADVNVATKGDGRGNRPLHFTCVFGGEKLAKLLIDGGANVNGTCAHGQTALHLAVQQGLVELVDVLLGGGALVDTKNNEGLEAVDLASRSYSQVPAQHFESCSVATTLDSLRVKTLPLIMTQMRVGKSTPPGTAGDKGNTELSAGLGH